MPPVGTGFPAFGFLALAAGEESHRSRLAHAQAQMKHQTLKMTSRGSKGRCRDIEPQENSYLLVPLRHMWRHLPGCKVKGHFLISLLLFIEADGSCGRECMRAVPERGSGKRTASKGHQEAGTGDLPQHCPHTVLPSTPKDRHHPPSTSSVETVSPFSSFLYSQVGQLTFNTLSSINQFLLINPHGNLTE